MTMLERLIDALARRGAALDMRAGASESDIDAAEAAIGRTLPPELREWYRATDGPTTATPHDPGAVHLFPADMMLYSLEALVAEHANQAAMHTEDGHDVLGAGDWIRRVSWHAARIPFAGAEGTAWLWTDGVPGPNGHQGQVVYNTSESDVAVLGTSFADFLERYIAALDAGTLIVTPVDGAYFVHAAGRDPTVDFYDLFCLAE